MSSITKRIRGSCNSCATSKIKCPKQRPSCSKCISRGVACHYSFTKRPGRKPENGIRRPFNESMLVGETPESHPLRDSNNKPNESNHFRSECHSADQTAQLSLESVLWPESPTNFSMSSSNASGTQPDTNDYLDIQGDTVTQNVASSLGLESTPIQSGPSDSLGIFHDIETFSGLDTFDSEQDRFLGSVIEPSLALFAPNDSTSSKVPNSGTHNDIASILIPEARPNPVIGSSEPSSVADSGISISPPSSLLPTSRLLGPTGSSSLGQHVLPQALDILQKLSSTKSFRSITATASRDSSFSPDALTQAIITENRQILGAMNSMISSPSSGNDNFLFAILYMAVLKILERYDVAVNTQYMGIEFEKGHGSSQESRGARNDLFFDDNPNRELEAEKLVLGELHRVQRLANEISHIFKKQGEGIEKQFVDGGKIATALVTTETLARLDADMRQTLKALSTGIIDRLRQR